MANSSDTVTEVRIYNQVYEIRGEDPEHVQRLAGLLHDKMTEIAELTATVDTAKVAILAALNLADEYVSKCAELNELRRNLSEESEKILSKLREAEKQSADSAEMIY